MCDERGGGGRKEGAGVVEELAKCPAGGGGANDGLAEEDEDEEPCETGEPVKKGLAGCAHVFGSEVENEGKDEPGTRGEWR